MVDTCGQSLIRYLYDQQQYLDWNIMCNAGQNVSDPSVRCIFALHALHSSSGYTPQVVAQGKLSYGQHCDYQSRGGLRGEQLFYEQLPTTNLVNIDG